MLIMIVTAGIQMLRNVAVDSIEKRCVGEYTPLDSLIYDQRRRIVTHSIFGILQQMVYLTS